MVRLQERPEVVEVFLTARRAPTPKPEANAVGVKDLAEVSMTIFAEETGQVDTRDVGTQVDFPSVYGCSASDRCGCVPDKLARPEAETWVQKQSAEASERLRSAVDLGEDLATFSGAGDPEHHPSTGPVYFASETNDDSAFDPEFDSEDVLDGVLESALDDFSDPMDDASGLSDIPVQRLEREYERVTRVPVEELDLKPAVYLREGAEVLAQLSDHLTIFPELEELSPEYDTAKTEVGVPGVTTPEMEDKMRKILNYHRRIFLGDGNAALAPARGVVCDLDGGDAMPIALRARQIASRYLVKVYELLKKLLETGLIEHSESEWSSPIVIVSKKNGEDIRMLVNQLIKLSRYPLPLIDDLLTDFNAAAWFMSLDMASGFWEIQMTERAKLISAFICPFGHFQ
ncbi:reverse transcriptase [Phytophthora megakarya]|uniref:Reverse transcriptase n=1 Tax=Phytophthora megakarya TaxID=4795 RepID=A0A225VHP6_9STRA|nr:reverse transcriptase [Phytophthora megakarya]